MSTKVLIVDEAAGTSALFARILRSLDCTIYEALDAGKAVEVLDKTGINLAVIAAEMSFLSGLDLLQALRASEKYANLPVVITTGGTDESTVMELLKLGIVDCLTKPFDIAALKQRFERVLKTVAMAGSQPAMVAAATPGATGSALIADQNPEFRHLVSSVLMANYTTMQVESGLEALRACQLRRFSLLVMGVDTGLLAPPLLARRLRRQPTLDDMRIVLVAPKDACREVVDPSVFDAILTRTFVPEEFAQQFQQLFARSHTGVSGTIDDVRRTVVSATEQALGMMAKTEVALVADDAVTLPAGTLEAFVVMTLQMERAAVRMALRCDAASATRIAARMMGAADADVAPEDGLSALGEMVNVIAGRVKSQITSEGGTMSFTLPEMAAVDPDTAIPAAEATLRFASPDHELALSLYLSIAGARHDS
jgi:DNA-binding response OmpR family regulator